jgi:hypothetical protein
MTQPETTVTCQESGERFRVTLADHGGTWHAVEATPLREGGSAEHAGSEGSEQVTLDGIAPGHDYDGCPDCGNSQFVQCFGCDELSCYDGHSETAYCYHCDVQITIEGNIDEFEATEASRETTELAQSESTSQIRRE